MSPISDIETCRNMECVRAIALSKKNRRKYSDLHDVRTSGTNTNQINVTRLLELADVITGNVHIAVMRK